MSLQSTATLQTFFLAMVQHPEVQQVAHDELDRMVGTGRLPEPEDESQLPFITAVMYEVLRYVLSTILRPFSHSVSLDGALSFRSVSMLSRVTCHFAHRLIGVPHRSIRDDEYYGYHIPKGSLVISNIWYVHFEFSTKFRALSSVHLGRSSTTKTHTQIQKHSTQIGFSTQTGR